MAFCPKCNGVLEPTAVVCLQCGYDFPMPVAPRRNGIAYTPLADIALIVGIIAAGLGCAAAAVATIGSLLKQDFWNGLVIGPLAFFLQLALLVVFVRVQGIGADSNQHPRGQ